MFAVPSQHPRDSQTTTPFKQPLPRAKAAANGLLDAKAALSAVLGHSSKARSGGQEQKQQPQHPPSQQQQQQQLRRRLPAAAPASSSGAQSLSLAPLVSSNATMAALPGQKHVACTQNRTKALQAVQLPAPPVLQPMASQQASHSSQPHQPLLGRRSGASNAPAASNRWQQWQCGGAIVAPATLPELRSSLAGIKRPGQPAVQHDGDQPGTTAGTCTQIACILCSHLQGAQAHTGCRCLRPQYATQHSVNPA